MAKKELVTKVWIEEGCIVCDACETTAPDVFEVLEDTCIIRPEAMKPDFTKPRSEAIEDAAEECPVDVIKYDVVTEDVADDAPAGEAETDAEAPEPATADKSSETKAAKAEESPEAKPGKAPEAKADEPAKAKPEKSPESKPAQAPKGKPEPVASTAGQPDPSIQALLRAATARGGGEGILRKGKATSVAASLGSKDPSELPPDARQARVMEEAKKAAKHPDSSRRAFVGSAALTTGWVLFGVGTGVSVGPAFARFMMPNVLEEPDPRVRVGKLQKYVEMAPGGVNEDYKPQGIWMIRLEDRIAALSIICTHLGCIPNWLPNDRKFKCPCHGSGYRQNGINFEGPTPRPLERFRLFIEDGVVIVDKSKKYQYELGQWEMPGSYIEV